jgi:transglutaminase/protease-like cytokinesis protein 3
MIKRFLLLCLFFSLTLNAQDFSNVDALVLNYPRFSKVEQLANQIEKDFSTDEEKARAAFYWLAKNIRYNLREFYNPVQRSYSFSYSSEAEKIEKQQAVMDKLVIATFRNKTGVCEEYARSFKKICDLLYIKSEVITGNVRLNSNEIGTVKTQTNHAWNAVYLNERWVILDATWAAGYEYNNRWVRKFNDYFFDIPTDKIFKTHYPEDSVWILRFGRISIEEFYAQPIYTNTFLGLDAELITPTKGTIRVNSDDTIELKFKNLDPDLLIFYSIKGNKYTEKPVIKTENDISTVFIKNPKRSTDLILFINKTDALHFKVEVN